MSRALSSSPLPKSRIAPRWGVELRVLWGDRILGEYFLHSGVDREFRMGSGAGVDFAMSAHLFDQESFDAVVSRNGAFELRFTAQMEGTLWKHGEAQELSALVESRIAEEVRDGVYGIELGWGDAAVVEFGPLRFEAASRKAPSQVLVPLEEKVDFAFLSVALVMLLIGAGFVTTALTTHGADEYSDDISADDREKIVKVIFNAMKAPQTNPLLKQHTQKKEQQAARESSKKPEGKLGAVNAPKEQKRGNAHQEAVKLARSIFAGKSNDGIFASIDKSMDEAMGGLVGKEIGKSDGSLFGLGLKGGKDGNGGTSDLFQIGGPNRGKGVRIEGGPDYGAGILCAKPPCKGTTVVTVAPEDPVVTGSLDRELIRQVIHSHRSQIRYCYESELQRSPTLAGKVGVNFVISEHGTVSVSRVASTTMNNAAVETCVAGRVRTWIFPKPKGGGQVIVQYPFVFKSTGQ